MVTYNHVMVMYCGECQLVVMCGLNNHSLLL
jgi:hypothetical protein